VSGLTTALLIELLVAVLLAVSIGYCAMLNRRLARFKADEESLRGTIGELVTATEIAERAIRTLKSTANDADRVLGARLASAESAADELSRLIDLAQRARPQPAAPEPMRAHGATARSAGLAPSRPAFAHRR
jgi:hypothetical protein